MANQKEEKGLCIGILQDIGDLVGWVVVKRNNPETFLTRFNTYRKDRHYFITC